MDKKDLAARIWDDIAEKVHPVHCVQCGKTYSRKYIPLGDCKNCNGTLVWTFTGRTKPA